MTAGFPVTDPVGHAVQGLPEAVEVIASHIAPFASQVDQTGVRRAAFEALADAGLHGSPLQPTSAQRELAELLAGSDASTWFCWTQHQSPLNALERASSGRIQHRLLRDASTGRMLCGVAFAQLRRPGPPNPIARRTAGGWVVDGTLDWVTSWDIADWFLLMVRVEGEDRVLGAMLPAGRGQVDGAVPGLSAGPPLELLAMSGTHTRPLRLDGVLLHDEDVLEVGDLSSWRAEDELKAANANPATFGIARGALADLHLMLQRRPDDELGEWLSELIEQVRSCRQEAYALADEAPGPGGRGELLAARRIARARALRLAQQATTAVIVAQSGGSMATGTGAERRAREALFMHVQAQTADAARAYSRLARDSARVGEMEDRRRLTFVP